MATPKRSGDPNITTQYMDQWFRADETILAHASITRPGKWIVWGYGSLSHLFFDDATAAMNAADEIRRAQQLTLAAAKSPKVSRATRRSMSHA